MKMSLLAVGIILFTLLGSVLMAASLKTGSGAWLLLVLPVVAGMIISILSLCESLRVRN